MTGTAPDFEGAIASALARDHGVARLLREGRFAQPGRASRLPGLSLGHTRVVDWSRGGFDGSEHLVTLHVHGSGGSKAETFDIMDKVSALLDDALLPCGDGGLLRLKLQFAKARQEPDSSDYHGILRFSATPQSLA